MKSLFAIIIGVVIYVVFCLIATPFLSFNFGAKPNLLEKILDFFIKHPFGYFFINISWGMGMILMLLLNGIFWSILILKGVPIIKRMILK